MENRQKKLVLWGIYDRSHPRIKILINGLSKNDYEVTEIHYDCWDKLRVKTEYPAYLLAWRVIRGVLAYPALIYRYLRAPAHDAVLVAYPGVVDVCVMWLLARWRKTPLIWDVYISIYEMIVEDRKLVSPSSLVARIIYGAEYFAARLPAILLMDTKAHADYFAQHNRIAPARMGVVWVGADTEYFYPPATGEQQPAPQTLRVLFYGQFIPLHGIDTILEAARIVRQHNPGITFTIIGTGQVAAEADAFIAAHQLTNISRIEWVSYSALREEIGKADICLGIFGNTEKAARVIPNKAYQVLACHKPLITRDSPAIREAFSESEWLRLVPPASPQALAEAILNHTPPRAHPASDSDKRIVISEQHVGAQLAAIIDRL